MQGNSGRLARGRGIDRQEETLARCELVRLREPILVQLNDLVGTMRVSQPISRDAPERLVTSDDVDRQRRTTWSRAAGPRA